MNLLIKLTLSVLALAVIANGEKLSKDLDYILIVHWFYNMLHQRSCKTKFQL